MSLSSPFNVIASYTLKPKTFLRDPKLVSRSHQVTSFPLASIFQTHEPSKNLKLTKRATLKPVSSLETAPTSSSSSTFRNKPPSEINVLVVGSTGYIGRFVVKELVQRGFNVIAVAREKSGVRGKNDKEETLKQLRGSNVCFSGANMFKLN